MMTKVTRAKQSFTITRIPTDGDSKMEMSLTFPIEALHGLESALNTIQFQSDIVCVVRLIPDPDRNVRK